MIVSNRDLDDPRVQSHARHREHRPPGPAGAARVGIATRVGCILLVLLPVRTPLAQNSRCDEHGSMAPRSEKMDHADEATAAQLRRRNLHARVTIAALEVTRSRSARARWRSASARRCWLLASSRCRRPTMRLARLAKSPGAKSPAAHGPGLCARQPGGRPRGASLRMTAAQRRPRWRTPAESLPNSAQWELTR